ncbi:glycosyltransferase family 4 protein [Micromonospora sp. DT233]|uniref:glycosyltransferase family 4 protein n=1 Tax=Micromonospora sp. DT233 TaxID=3393432 RepID=UPI003CF4340D
MLTAADGHPAAPEGGPVVLPVAGKALDGAAFWSYTAALSAALRERFAAADYHVVHLQHLAFGATPALQHAFPHLPQVAIVHGTDLLYAETYAAQAEVLRRTVNTADAVVVPTLAMADRLVPLVDGLPKRIVHIPWGVPDELLGSGGEPGRESPGKLRILYAGRLTAEKATGSVLSTVAGLDGVVLSVAAPAAEYALLAGDGALCGVRYLGWLTRPALWQEFARHDLLIVPSVKLEAFGLVAVEAQACGLPVAFQAVPGLSEVLLDSGFRVDFSDAGRVAVLVEKLRANPALLAETREAGRANSARFPLSATASALRKLSADLVARAPTARRGGAGR